MKSLDHIEPYALNEESGIILRKIVETAEVGLALCFIPKNTIHKEDGKPWLHFFYRLSGKSQLRLEGKIFDICPGMHVLIPENTPYELLPGESSEDIVQIAFYGSEQLPGSFFNTYRRADVEAS